jgi:hypothetical protein
MMTDPTCRRVLFWSIGLSVAWPVIVILLWIGPFQLWFLGTIGAFALWIMTAAFALGLVITSALARNWAWCLAAAPLPLTALLVALNFGTAWRAGQFAGDYVHFLVKYSSYRSEITKQQNEGSRFLVDDWGGPLPHVSRGLVYDETDEIAKPAGEQSEEWKDRVRGSEGQCIQGYTPIGGHFYLVALDC